MSGTAGQAVRGGGQALRRVLRLVRLVGALALAMVVLLAVAAGMLAWRLDQGPLELPWLAQRLANGLGGSGPTRVTIADASLQWDGFSHGVDQPLVLRLGGLATVDPDGTRHATLARAEMSLSVGDLLIGRVVPRTIILNGARLQMMRAADGATTLDLGSLGGGGTDTASGGDVLAQLSLPPATDHDAGASRWSQLRKIRIGDTLVTVEDRQLGASWTAQTDADLTRAATGGMDGTAHAALALGSQQATLSLEAHLHDGGTAIAAALTQLSPAALASAAPGLAGLAVLDAPVTLHASGEFAADFSPRHLHAQLVLGAGTAALGAGHVLLTGASLAADGTPEAFTVAIERLAVVPREGGAASTAHGTLQVSRGASQIAATAVLDLDQAGFADLPELWPVALSGKDARAWITENITAGTASALHAELGLHAATDLSDIHLDRLAGGMDGHDLTTHWLRPVPPIEHGEAHLTFHSPDEFDIAVTAGKQSGSAIVIHGGGVKLTGLAQRDQVADIDADLTGPVADLLTVLRHPRLKLLDKHPVTTNNPTGQFSGHLGLGHIPLEKHVDVDQIAIHATIKLADAHLGGIVAGRNMDHGNLDIDVTNDALKLAGPAQLSGIPAQLFVAMDFRKGPPSQVIQTVHVTGSVDPAQLRANGINPDGVATGRAGVTATYEEQRGGHAEIGARADLGRAGLSVAPFGWSKQEGRPAIAELHLTLEHDRLTALDRAEIHGEGIDGSATMQFTDGKPAVLRLARLALGSTTDVHGQLRWPAADGGWGLTLAGPSLDLSAPMKSRHDRTPGKDDDRLPDGAVDVSLGRVLLGQDRALSAVTLKGRAQGDSIREADLHGRVGATDPFVLGIAPGPTGRLLDGDVPDLGSLLRALDVTGDMEGGRLAISGSYDDQPGRPGRTLSGQAEISDFRIRRAPLVAKLLQAATLYGLVSALQGPGMGVTGVVVPFRLTGEVLELSDSRAYNASLGATVKGRVDLGSGSCDLNGTIVPLYFFNTLPGKIPLIGKLFSPERGGGLFAATYSISGPCDDPLVGVNPLATLTPGFLRGLFGIFGK